jgi:DNA-binding CsgD family transcriptional regulator
MSKNSLDMSRAQTSWRYTVEDEPDSGREMEIGAFNNGFFTYTLDNGDVFRGLHNPVTLYAKDSPFAGELFAKALLIPEAEFEAKAAAANRRLLLHGLLFMCCGAACSFVLSKWYVRPVLKGINAIREVLADAGQPAAPVNIPEIDDLMEFLATRNAADNSQEADALKTGLLEARLEENIFELSAAEKNVFDLYLEGRSAKEIAEALNLSVNTIKTHNRHIFIKLKVSSRNELMTRVQELREKRNK